MKETGILSSGKDHYFNKQFKSHSLKNAVMIMSQALPVKLIAGGLQQRITDNLFYGIGIAYIY
jgi:hypothetical protein